MDYAGYIRYNNIPVLIGSDIINMSWFYERRHKQITIYSLCATL